MLGQDSSTLWVSEPYKPRPTALGLQRAPREPAPAQAYSANARGALQTAAMDGQDQRSPCAPERWPKSRLVRGVGPRGEQRLGWHAWALGFSRREKLTIIG